MVKVLINNKIKYLSSPLPTPNTVDIDPFTLGCQGQIWKMNNGFHTSDNLSLQLVSDIVLYCPKGFLAWNVDVVSLIPAIYRVFIFSLAGD